MGNTIDNSQKKKFHLIGIKGTGMTSLASILYDLGYSVSGSDYEEEYFTSKELRKRNFEISIFQKENIQEDKIYIASSCYGMENVEVEEVIKRKLPFYYYHEFIEDFFKGTKIAVSGSHGKTTTTTFLANFIPNSTYLIGDGSGFGTREYQYFVYEACEYKDHFLSYTNDYLIINNIDLDHPDYFKSMDQLIESFQKAANRSRHVVLNGDDVNASKVNHMSKTTFGFQEKNDIIVNIIKEYPTGYDLEINVENKKYQFYLPFPGRYMIYNFLASFSILYLCNIDISNLQENLNHFRKPKRRMEEIGIKNNVIIDDYAHHPTEIEALLKAVKQKYPMKEIIVCFQPHTYTRTLELEEGFSHLFLDVNLFYLEKTFSSKRENQNSELEREIQRIFHYPKNFNEDLLEEFAKKENSVFIFLGAGNINRHIPTLLCKFSL